MRTVTIALAALAATSLCGCENTVVKGPPNAPSAPAAVSVLHSDRGTLYAGILDSAPSEVLEYAAPFTHRTGKITQDVDIGQCCLHECNNAMTVTDSGELFVANYGNNTITGYATPRYGQGKKPGTLLDLITNGVSTPCGIVADRRGDLFVTMGAGHYGNSTLYEYASPYSTVTREFDEPCQILWHAFNGQGNLFVQSCNEIIEYARPQWQEVAEITAGLDEPTRFTFDGYNNLFVANEGNSTVTEYACCKYAESPSHTYDVTLDVVNQLFAYNGYVCIVNGSGSNITCLQPPSGSTYVLTNGLDYPGYAIVGEKKELLVSDCCPTAARIAIFAWPWFNASGGNLVKTFGVRAWPMAYAP
jgi:hypothetical protein